MKTGCVILAAGRGERFGGNKMTAPAAGVPLLERTVRNIPMECFGPVIAVVSSEETEILCARIGVKTVRYSGGPVSDSIREGLRSMRETDACLFVNGDQPLIRPQSIRRILQAGESHPGAIIRLAWAGTSGSPVLFPSGAFSELESLTGDTGGRQVIRSGKYAVLTVEAETGAELLDIDTVKEMQELSGLFD